MRQRKFSFDLPRLKLGQLPFTQQKNWNSEYGLPQDPESPGEVPKTIRPLPNDLDAALRAACTGVLRNNKPSHEYHKNGKAQLDYATIRSGGGQRPAPRRPDAPSAPLSKSDSNEERAQAQRDSLQAGAISPGKAHRMSTMSGITDVQTQGQDGGYQPRVVRSRAQSRADQLMGGDAPKPAEPQRQRADSQSQHSRSQSTPQHSWTFPPQKAGPTERPKPAPRAHSMETTSSTPQTDKTEFAWTASAAETTAEETPELVSQIAARKKVPSAAVDADWMQDDAERRRLLEQQAFAETALSRHATWTDPKLDTTTLQDGSKSPDSDSQTTTPVAKVPARKPVPAAEPVASPEPMASPGLSSALSSPEIEYQAFEQDEARPESRNDRGRARGTGVPLNSRAVSRARSVTREVKQFMRNASRNVSRTRQPKIKTDEASTHTRSRRPSMSRTRDVASNVKDYFRPGTAAGKQSLDVPRNAADLKSKSHESFVSARSDASPAKDTPMQHSQRSSQYQKHMSMSTGPVSRNSFEADDDASMQNGGMSSETLQQKRDVDLNRALPPLPRLDSWHAEQSAPPTIVAPESPGNAPEVSKHMSGSGLPSPGLSSTTTLKKVSTRESRSPMPSPKLGGVHDYVALRMGAPVSRQASKAKPRERGNPNLASQAARASRRGPIDPNRDQVRSGADYGFPPQSKPITQTKRGDSSTARRRSKSVQDVNAPDLSEKLRQASANAPDGRPIHAVGQAKLVNTSSSGLHQFDGLASKIGRKLSTKRRNITPTTPQPQHPPMPPPHRELPQRKAKTASSTPYGLSRANSTYHSNSQYAQSRTSLSRKMSMEEYGRNYDDRYHKNNDLVAPPPVAVAGSKSSPRIGFGNLIPAKYQPQQPQHSQQQSGSKKWWHLGLSNAGESEKPMDQASTRTGPGMDRAGSGLGVRY